MAETPNSPLPEPSEAVDPVASPADAPSPEPAAGATTPVEASVLEVTTFAVAISEGSGLDGGPVGEEPTSGEPTVATTVDVAPLAAADAGASEAGPGGEWDLLVAKLKDWLERSDLPGQWDRLGGPLRGLGLLLALLLVLKLYVALLDTLDDLPLLPRLLQLVGLIVVLRFSLTRLTRSSERQLILEDWKRRWQAFRGA